MKRPSELKEKDKGTVGDMESYRGKADRWKESEIEADTLQRQWETDTAR